MPTGASQVVLVVKNPPASTGDIRNRGLIPGIGNGNLLQYSCLEDSTDSGDLRVTIHRVAKESEHVHTHPEFTLVYPSLVSPPLLLLHPPHLSPHYEERIIEKIEY